MAAGTDQEKDEGPILEAVEDLASQAAPYTLTDALEGLFIEEEQFKGILEARGAKEEHHSPRTARRWQNLCV